MIEKASTIPVNIINGGYDYCRLGEACRYITEPTTMGDYLLYLILAIAVSILITLPFLAIILLIRHVKNKEKCNFINS